MTRKRTWPFVIAGVAGSAGTAMGQATFAPGTSSEYRQMIQVAIQEAGGLDLFVEGGPWGGGALGDPIRLDYSLVPDGLLIPSQFGGDSAGNSSLFATLDAQFGGDRDAWQQVIADAMSAWADASGLTVAFRQRVIPGGEDPADNWDDGSDWDLDIGDGDGVNGPASDGTVTERGDLRIGMRSIDGPGGIVAFTLGTDASDIVLDADEDWEDAATLHRFFENATGRVVGTAVGLEDACPNDGTKLMEPVLALGFAGPQTDDIRAIHRLYGDNDEANDAIADSVFLASYNTSQPAPVVAPRSNVSLDADDDVDVYSFRILGPNPSVRAFITLEPIGGLYDSGPAVLGSCLDPNIEPVNSGAVQDLSFSIQNDDGDILNEGGMPVDETGAGENEELIFQITAGGNYNIVIEGDGDDSVQLYRLTIVFESDLGDDGEILNDALVALGVDDFRDDGIRGGTSLILNLEGQRARSNHIVFFGRQPEVVDWDGLNPALDTEDGHSTGVLGVAGGSQFDTFRGVADEASLATGSVARQLLLGDTFLVSRQALTHALFRSTTVEGAAELGLPRPVTVVNSSWGTFGDFVGEGQFARAYDAAAYMHRVTMVHAVGNGGFTDAQCAPGTTGGSGTAFIGERTITSPASSYNGISVGSAGNDTFDIVDDPDDDSDSLADFFANLGIPLAPGPDLSFGVPILLDPSSSRGPVNSFDHSTGLTVPQTRSGVDIVAIGAGGIQYFSPVFIMNPCDWAGHGIISGVTIPFVDSDNTDDTSFFVPNIGSSFAAAEVSGAVALLQDAAMNEDPPLSTDPLVMKSVLQNAATRLFGWSNTGEEIGLPQDSRDGGGGGSPSTTNRSPFDYGQGAGLLNFTNSRIQYLFGIRDVAETDPTVPTITRDIPAFEPGIGGTAQAQVVAPGRSPENARSNAISAAKSLRAAAREAGDESIAVDHRRPDMNDAPTGHVPPLGPGVSNGDIGVTPFQPFRSVGGIPGSGGGPGGGGGGGPDPMGVTVTPNRLFVGRLGWDRGMIGQVTMPDPTNPDGDPVQAGFIDYVVGPVFTGESIRLTLNWMRTIEFADEPDFTDPLNPELPPVSELELENLDLAVFLALDDTGALPADPVGESLLAFSSSQLNNAEHIQLAIDPSVAFPGFQAFVIVRVIWTGTDYDLFNNLPDAETEYALTWNVDYGQFEAPPAQETSVSDLNSVISKFGAKHGEPDYAIAADFTRDHKIGIEDLNYVLTHWSN